MNDKSINSLISAYYDGELTAAEQAKVDQLLATSPEAQAELSAYRQMSSLVREARLPALQIDLAPLVMQSIAQQAIGQPTEQPAQPVRPATQRNWSRWVAVAAAAAAVMVAARLGWQAQPQAPAVAELNSKQPKLNANETEPGNLNKPASQNGTSSENKIATTETHAIAANQIEPVKPVTPAPQPVDVQLTSSDLPLQVIENLKRASPGKIVRFLKQSGKDVAVFHLMVLDTKPGLESLQMILSAQQISGPMGEVGQSGVMAVYVEANQGQLDKVIAELQSKDQEQFVALAVQPLPMKSADVQKVVNQPMNVASLQVPLKQDQLQSLGVTPVQSEQILASRNGRSGMMPSLPKALNGDDSAMRKLLIVVEKADESLLPPTTAPQN